MNNNTSKSNMADIIRLAKKYTTHKLPVPKKVLSTLNALLAEEDPHLATVTSIIAHDISLAIAILSHVNAIKRKSGKLEVDNIDSAVHLIGMSEIESIVNNLPVLETDFPDVEQQHAYIEFSQVIQHAASHALHWASLRKDKSPSEVYTATLLNMATYCYICLYDFDLYKEIYQRFEKTNEPINGSASLILDVRYTYFAMEVTKQLGLPELVYDSLDPKMYQFYRPIGIMIALELAIQAKHGWYHEGMLQVEEVLSDYLSVNMNTTVKHVHEQAIEFSRHEISDGVEPVAASLCTASTED
jgi:hypothetical protein